MDKCGNCSTVLPSVSSSWSVSAMIQTSYCEGDAAGKANAESMSKMMREVEQQSLDKKTCRQCGWSKALGGGKQMPASHFQYIGMREKQEVAGLSAPRCPRCGNMTTVFNSSASSTDGGSTARVLSQREKDELEKLRLVGIPKCNDRPCYMGKYCDIMNVWPSWAHHYCWHCNKNFCYKPQTTRPFIDPDFDLVAQSKES